MSSIEKDFLAGLLLIVFLLSVSIVVFFYQLYHVVKEWQARRREYGLSHRELAAQVFSYAIKKDDRL